MKNVSNMYGFVDITRNPIIGRCPYACDYCYAKHFHNYESFNFQFKESTLNNLGENRTIFIGSRIDLWNDLIKKEILSFILRCCRKYDNTYLFQSKNPERFHEFITEFPEKSILCTTIETNREELIKAVSQAPPVHERVEAMQELNWPKKMVTVEPIMNFDIAELIAMIEAIKPDCINVGADSKGHNLSEPSATKVRILISRLKGLGFKVIEKHNLRRITK